MKFLKTFVIVALCILAVGCGKSKDVSNTSAFEDGITSDRVGNVCFEMPISWFKSAKEDENGKTYYGKDVYFMVRMSDADYSSFDNMSEKEIEAFYELQSDSFDEYEEIEKGYGKIYGEKSIWVNANVKKDGSDYSFSQSAFIYGNKIYGFTMLVESDSEYDYKANFESILESVHMKEEEQQENSDDGKTREEQLEEVYNTLKTDALNEIKDFERNDDNDELMYQYFDEMYTYMSTINKFGDAEDEDARGKFVTTVSYFYSKFDDGTVQKQVGTLGFEAIHSLIFEDGNYQTKMQEMKSVYDTIQKPTMGQKNALKKAKSYLSHSAFSYSGLVKQLEFEKYTHEEAVYAVDNCGADWNEQAAKKAKSYLSHSSFSRDGLIDQLEYEGFTHEQAVYGVEQNGY